jgi:hypothetical protein
MGAHPRKDDAQRDVRTSGACIEAWHVCFEHGHPADTSTGGSARSVKRTGRVKCRDFPFPPTSVPHSTPQCRDAYAHLPGAREVGLRKGAIDLDHAPEEGGHIGMMSRANANESHRSCVVVFDVHLGRALGGLRGRSGGVRGSFNELHNKHGSIRELSRLRTPHAQQKPRMSDPHFRRTGRTEADDLDPRPAPAPGASEASASARGRLERAMVRY